MLGGSGLQTTTPTAVDDQVNENLRMRQLLKVLAVSDVVIYKTRAERLHSDLFYFLGDASKAYNEHFSAELQRVRGSASSCMMGPAIVIFHETQFTDVLSVDDSGRTPEVAIR